MAENVLYRYSPREYMGYHYQAMVPLVPVHQWIYHTPSINGRHPCSTPESESPKREVCYYENPRPGLYYIIAPYGETVIDQMQVHPETPRSTTSKSIKRRRELLKQKYQRQEEEWTAVEALMVLSQDATFLPPRNNRQQATTPKLRGYISKAVRRLEVLFDEEPLSPTQLEFTEVEESREVLLDGRYEDITDSEWEDDDADSDETNDHSADEEESDHESDYDASDECSDVSTEYSVSDTSSSCDEDDCGSCGFCIDNVDHEETVIG